MDKENYGIIKPTRNYDNKNMTKAKTYILLTLIIALGLFLRTYKIDQAPPGIYPDEAVNGIDAVRAETTGDFQWFYPDNNGREGLYMNLIAICFKFFGVSVFTFKLASILIGTLTIWGVYLLGAELFRNERVGLISAFLTAVSFWAINFSRIAFRAVMLPAILAFSFYFLFRGARTKKWYDFAAGGLIFGLGLHTYIPFRIAPLVLLVMLFVLIINRKHFIRGYWKYVTLFVLATFLTAAPMLYTFFISHPEYWQSRTSEVSILNPEINHGHLLATFGRTFGLSLVKYNFWGDQNWRHNFPPYGILDPLTGIAFMFGLVYAVLKLLHLFYLKFKRGIHDEKIEVYVFLLSLFFVMLVPEIMAADANPHALRSIGTLPVVFILSGLTFNYFFEYSGRYGRLFQKIVLVLMLLIFTAIGFFNAAKYAIWAQKPETAQAFEKTMLDAENYIRTLPAGKEIYVVAGNMQRVPPRFFNWGNPNFHDLHPVDIDKVKPENPDNFVVVYTDYEKDKIEENLKSRFPNMSVEERKDDFGLSFYIFK